nr:hypothetical protein [Tanacetum cinerariifolium]
MYIFDSLVRNVDSSTKFYMYSRFLQLMIRAQVGWGKGCSRVETPLFEGMIVEQQVGKVADEVHDEGILAAPVAAEGAASVADDEVPAAKVGTTQRVETSDDTVMDDVSKQGRIIADIDVDKDVTLKDVAAVAKDVQDDEIEESLDEQMDEEESRALKRLSESQEDKAAKKQKLDKEVAELKRHFQIVLNDEDDVYTEATPLARKVPVVDYEIYTDTTYSSSPNQLFEEFADELALITFPPKYDDDLQFDIESDLKEIEYILHHDPIKDIDSSLKDLIDQNNLADLNDNLVDSM